MTSLTNQLLCKTQIPMLNSALDAYARRQRTIAHNVANVNTIGYQHKKVRFEKYVNEKLYRSTKALTRTDDRHFPSDEKDCYVNSNVDISNKDFFNGINNVNIEEEMAELAKNQIRYNVMTSLTTKHHRLLRMAIRTR